MSGSGAQLPIRDRLQGLAHELEHVLPAQAPIRDFVHHNTLHGYQHLDFRDAIIAARGLTGHAGWLPEALCRRYWREGRISDHDLDQALDRLAADPEHRATDRVALCHGAEPLPPGRLNWEIEENGALQRFQSDVPQSARARLLAAARTAAGDTPAAGALGDLWDACRELVATPPTPRPAAADLAAAADARLDPLWSAVGSESTWRGLLRALTGVDLMDELRPLLVRAVAPHLDHGIAAWHAPQRHRGLYAAWRDVTLADPERRLEEGADLRSLAESLPEQATDALLVLLPQTGLDEALWPGYLKRLALELPGWAGMVLWRQQHPDYQPAIGTPPISADILDFLAVHLACEQVLAARVIHALWSLRPRFDLLRWYFRHHPAEAVVRIARFAGSPGPSARRLPEALADAAQQLIAVGRLEPETDTAEWQALATEILAGEAEPGEADAQRAWPLFRIAQHLGLDAATARAQGSAAANARLRRLDWLDADRRGEIWLLAYEGHYREQILGALLANHGRPETRPPGPAIAQLVFCMDDREEGMRRHLEEVCPRIETFGAAGFFGIAMYWTGIDDEAPAALCPVVVTPAHAACEMPAEGAEADWPRHRQRRRRRLAWKETIFQKTRHGLVAAGLVSTAGALVALPTLIGKVFAPGRIGSLARRLAEHHDRPLATRSHFAAAPPAAADPAPALARPGFSDDEQADRVANLLRTIGLVADFSPLVVIMGHGSHSQNNPHRSAYDCGACSGRHGGPNARVFAAMANRPEVRERLAARGIVIGDGTRFVGAQHDTGDDHFNWFDTDLLPAAHRPLLADLRRDLGEAARRHARERCRRFASAPTSIDGNAAHRHVADRTDDFAQARPELGHVTNACAMIGRRRMTRGCFFDRRAFLISYDPTLDADGRILEGILLAAGPVGAGISLEYYFSTVNNERYGCGTKVMHNLAGLVGVMEGAGSDLRTGLPQQMIEIHEAMRLLIICESTPAVLNAILDRQPALMELVGKGWVQVAAQAPAAADAAAAIEVFAPGRGWYPFVPAATEMPRVGASTEWFAGRREALPPALVGTTAR